MKIIISDSHIGTSMWQYAVLKKIGVNVSICTLSKHSKYLSDQKITKSFLLKNLHILPKLIVRFLFYMEKDLRSTDYVLCSFPPSRAIQLAKLPKRVSIIVNIGHRIHIHSKDLIKVNKFFSEIASDSRFVISAMQKFDLKYFQYYTNNEIKNYLPVTPFHLNLKPRRSAKSLDKNKIILIGPANNRDKLLPNISLDKLNHLSLVTAQKLGVDDAFTFSFIKDLYPSFTFQDLIKHPAFLIIPYSTFSISMVELYSLNIPCFVPSDEILYNEMNDVRLSPLYATDADVHELDNSLGLTSSPNNEKDLLKLGWMESMFFNEKDSFIRYSSIQELLGLIYSIDYERISIRMENENLSFYNKQIQNWSSFIKNLNIN